MTLLTENHPKFYRKYPSKMTLISMINYIRQTKVSNRYTSFLGTSSTQIVFTNTLLTHLLDVLNN